MTKLNIPGRLSGRNYVFDTGGKQPTEEDIQYMRSVIEQDEQAYARQFEQRFGMPIAYDEQPGTAIGRGLERGIPQFQSSLASALGAVGFEGAEDYLEGAATERRLETLRERPQVLDGADFRDVRGVPSGATYLGEIFGEQLPTIFGTVAGTGGAMLAGASAPVAAGLATLAVSYPQLFGSNIQRQEAQVAAGELGEVDVSTAALAALGQTALESASNMFLAGRIPGGVLRSMLENAPVEAVTEVGQQIIERRQAGLPLDSDDAYREYLDAGVAGGALGGLFGAAGGIRSRGDKTEDEAIDGTPPITTDVLDELGVPPTAPIRTRLENGQIATRDDALTALEEYANNAEQSPGTASLAPGIRAYVRQMREPSLSDVQPELESGEPQLPTDGAGLEDVVPTGTGQAAEGAAAPDAGGLDVPEGGPRAAGVTEEQQLAALTEAEALELAAENARPVATPTPPEQGAQRGEETAPPAPSTQEARASVRQYMQDNPNIRASKKDIDEIVEKLTSTRTTVEDATVDVLSRAEREGRPGPKREAAPEEEMIPGFDEMPDEPSVKGVDPFAEQEVQEQKAITPEEIESRTGAAPEPEPEPEPEIEGEAPAPAAPPAPQGLTTAEVGRNAIPGRTTGAAGQVIPAGIAPVEGRAPERRLTTEEQGEIDAALNNVRMRRSQVERVENDDLGNEIRRIYDEGRSDDFKAFAHEEVATDPTRDVTSVADKKKIVRLLNKNFPKSERRIKNPEWAAHLYFSKHADVMTSIDTIIHDAVASPVKQFRASKDMGAAAREYYSNTGRDWGRAAEKWVLENLGPEARLVVMDRRNFYRPPTSNSLKREIAASKKREKRIQMNREYQEWVDGLTGKKTRNPAILDSPIRDIDAPRGERGVFDPDVADELGFGTEDVPDIEAMFSKTAALDMPMHPQIVRAIQQNDINAALDGIIATSGSREASLLATKLRPFVQGTPIRMLDPQALAEMNMAFGDGTGRPAMGIYMPRYTQAELDQVNKRDGDPRRVALRSAYNGVVAINSESGLAASTLLHELMHVATVKVLKNESHPLTRQIETMLAEARKIMPEDTYGLINRYEFVSEGMTNPDFIQKLSQIDTGLGAQKFTLFERLRHALRNLHRQIMGQRAKPLRIEASNQKDALDQMLDDLLATDRNMRGVGELYNQTFDKRGPMDIMNSMKSRTIEATPTNMKELRKLARSGVQQLPFGDSLKDFVIRASMPLKFVVENAKRYIPSALELYDMINAHGSEVHRMSTRVEETLMPIRDFLKKNRDKVKLFNDARFLATEARVDPRKPRSAYEVFQVAYNELDADGEFVRRVTLNFKTRAEAGAKKTQLEADPTAENPAIVQSPDTPEGIDRLAAYDEVAKLYRELGEDGRAALNRAFELPEYFRNEMKRVVMIRLQSMLPGQRATQERIYKNVFEKIFAEALIDPYQALQRRGTFGLSYSARDPETGELKVFKHAFESSRLRDRAIVLLQDLGDKAEVDQITPYDMDKQAFLQNRPSLQFVSSLLNKIETEGRLASSELKNEIMSLVFESAPETSFVRSYQMRKDVPGYIGDITPLGFNMNMGDTMDNIRSNGMHLASRVADTEYQIKLDKLGAEIEKERLAFQQEASANLPIDERAPAVEEANTYAKVLQEFTRAPFRQRANWSRSLTAGGYALTLGYNVSTAAITFFQMPTIIYPYLAGKYGGRKSMGAIGEATRILGGSGRERTIERVSPEGGLESVRRKVGFYDFSVSNLDFDVDKNTGKPKNAYLKALRDVADIAGVFNRSLTQDVLDESGAKGWVQKIAAHSGLMQHHTERYMRESTLLSTYLMELHNRLPEGKALNFKQFVKALKDGRIEVPEAIGTAAAKEAVHISDMTNGSILAATAPALSQGDIGSVIYLFKRFPLAMLNMLWHTAKRSLDAQNDPVDRRIAAMQFGGMAGSIGLLSGLAGVPGFHMASALWNLIKDEEDEDLETLIRTGPLGERGLTGLVDYYAGISVSSRIGLSGTFYRPGFNTEDQKPLLTLLEGFGGPVVGLINKYTDRVPYFFQEGEYWRMTEALMPTSIGNAMKATRFYTEGARTLRYDPILDDVGPFAAGAQFFGFMPTEYARQLAKNNYLRGLDSGINEKRSKLMRKVYVFKRQGDMDSVRETMREIREFNRRYPHAKIDPKTLRKSLRSHRETTSRMHHGITFSSKNEGFLKRASSDFGDATYFSN